MTPWRPPRDRSTAAHRGARGLPPHLRTRATPSSPAHRSSTRRHPRHAESGRRTSRRTVPPAGPVLRLIRRTGPGQDVGTSAAGVNPEPIGVGTRCYRPPTMQSAKDCCQPADPLPSDIQSGERRVVSVQLLGHRITPRRAGPGSPWPRPGMSCAGLQSVVAAPRQPLADDHHGRVPSAEMTAAALLGNDRHPSAPPTASDRAVRISASRCAMMAS